MGGPALFAEAKKFVFFGEGVAVVGTPKDGAAAFMGTAPVEGDPKRNVAFELSVVVLEMAGTAPRVNGLLFSIVVIALLAAEAAPNVGILSEFAGVTTLDIELPPNANVVAVDDAGATNPLEASVVFNDDDPPKLKVGFAASAIGLSSFDCAPKANPPMLGLIPCMLVVVVALRLLTGALDFSGVLKAKPPSFGIAAATVVVVVSVVEKQVVVVATTNFGSTTALLVKSAGIGVVEGVVEVDVPNLNPTNGESTLSFIATVAKLDSGAPNENDEVTKR